MITEGFRVALTGLAAGLVFLILLTLTVKILSVIILGTVKPELDKRMAVPEGYPDKPSFSADAVVGTAGTDVSGVNDTGTTDEFQNIAVAIAAAKAHSDHIME
ncbi:MAG: hypothetical protein GXP33_11695 [Spirochaetes bacterium]|nr:hypothetical protein [Spirochaetota bacterium]